MQTDEQSDVQGDLQIPTMNQHGAALAFGWGMAVLALFSLLV